MRRATLVWLLAGVVGLGVPTVSPAQADIVSTTSLLQGCRSLIENDPNGNPMQMGACAGAVAATVEIARSQGRACAPAGGAGVVPAARVIVNYANESASHRAGAFGPMALAALSYHWRC